MGLRDLFFFLQILYYQSGHCDKSVYQVSFPKKNRRKMFSFISGKEKL